MILRFLQKGNRVTSSLKSTMGIKISGNLNQRFFSEKKNENRNLEGKPKENKPFFSKLKHFAELGRYRRQTGTLLLLSPCLWGVVINSPLPLSESESKNQYKSLFKFSIIQLCSFRLWSL